MTDTWIEGAFAASARAVDASDRGLLLGDGVFDTALVLGGRVHRRADHLERLTGALLLLEIPADPGEIGAAMDALAARRPNGSIRLTVTRGAGPRGLRFPDPARPTVLGSAAPLQPAAMFAPLCCVLSEVRRNETSPLSRLKSLGYLDAVLASRKAGLAGADEALFLNTKGVAACASLANLFVLEGFDLVTPPLKDGVLPGIVRRWVLANAADHGLRASEASLAPRRLAAADAVFLTNSLRLIAPASLEGRGGGPAAVPEAVRSLAEGLCRAIAAECGVDPRSLGASLPAIR